MIRLNTALRNSILDNAVGIGLSAGDLVVYTGAQPATADLAASGTLLVTINIASGLTVAAAGTFGLSAASESGVATATGTAGWGRFTDATDRVDGTVGTSGTDYIIDNAAITNGATVTLTQLDITMPAS
jgi:hypothetical protein